MSHPADTRRRQHRLRPTVPRGIRTSRMGRQHPSVDYRARIPFRASAAYVLLARVSHRGREPQSRGVLRRHQGQESRYLLEQVRGMRGQRLVN